MDYSRNYLVHYYEADSAQRLTLPALVRYFEDIAILHSASRGLDLDHYDANRCGWMLLKWDIVIHELPTFGQTVTVSTGVNAIRRFLADRRFAMADSSGRTLAEGRSNWLFVDTDKRRPLRVSESQFEAFSVDPASESRFVALADVVPVGQSGTELSQRSAADCGSLSAGTALSPALVTRARWSDIDTNRHVNNVSYVGWALDSLPADFVSGRRPVSLQAQYRKELALGDEAAVYCVQESPSLGAATSVATANPGATPVNAASFASSENPSDAAELTRHSVRLGAEELCSLAIGWRKYE